MRASDRVHTEQSTGNQTLERLSMISLVCQCEPDAALGLFVADNEPLQRTSEQALVLVPLVVVAREMSER